MLYCTHTVLVIYPGEGSFLLQLLLLSLFFTQSVKYQPFPHPSLLESHFHHVSDANEQQSESASCCFSNSNRGGGRRGGGGGGGTSLHLSELGVNQLTAQPDFETGLV